MAPGRKLKRYHSSGRPFPALDGLRRWNLCRPADPRQIPIRTRQWPRRQNQPGLLSNRSCQAFVFPSQPPPSLPRGQAAFPRRGFFSLSLIKLDEEKGKKVKKRRSNGRKKPSLL